MSTKQKRPWYCNDGLVDDYRKIQNSGGDLRMLQSLKVIRNTITNIVLGVVIFYAILQGADPTLVGVLGLAAFVAINGIDISEWLAAKQALEEIGTEDKGDDDS